MVKVAGLSVVDVRGQNKLGRTLGESAVLPADQ